jgi:hypothetical protein
MKPWHWIAIAVVITIAAGGWYFYQQQNRTLLSVETPAGSLQINENSEGVSVEVNGQ